MALHFQQYSSPIGVLCIAADESNLRAVLFRNAWWEWQQSAGPISEADSPLLLETRRQLDQYFAGDRTGFELPYKLCGTPFQLRVWNTLLTIPFGSTRSYTDQAVALRSPHASRAVGRANGLNPLCVVVPCHRVVGSNGDLSGYAGGMAAKKILLALEWAAARDKQEAL